MDAMNDTWVIYRDVTDQPGVLHVLKNSSSWSHVYTGVRVGENSNFDVRIFLTKKALTAALQRARTAFGKGKMQPQVMTYQDLIKRITPLEKQK